MSLACRTERGELDRGRNVHATQAGLLEHAAQQPPMDVIVVLVDRTCCSSITPPSTDVKTAGSGPWSQPAVQGVGGAGGPGGGGPGAPFTPPAYLGSFVVETGGPVLRWHPVPLPQPKDHVEQCGMMHALQHAVASETIKSVNAPES